MDKRIPKVSVIIPVYNVEQYLRQCLDSVTGQTLENMEIICVDDGSTDRSPEILQEYAERDHRITLLRQKNLGAGAARNLGMEEARGKFLYFMDSDDYCEGTLLEEAVETAEKSGADITVFDYCKFDQQTGEREYRSGLSEKRLPQGKTEFSYRDIPETICSTVIPTPWNKLFLRERIMECGLRYLPISTTNDITFATMAVLRARKVAYLKRTLLYYRVNLSGSTTSKKRNRLNNVITAVLSVDQQARELEYYREIKNAVRKFVIDNLFVALERYAGDEDSAQYTEYLQKIDAILYSHPLFLGMRKEDLRDRALLDRVMECRRRAMERNDLSFAPPLIVSMTSFPGRIGTVHKAICSLVTQTKRPERILLYLAKSQFPGGEADLPRELLDYCRCGLEIRWCDEDIRPHKKYFYAMQEFPEALIVTVDDDLRYDPYMLEVLFASYMKHSSAVSAMRTHLITEDEAGGIAPYAQWKKEYSGLVGVPSMQLFSTSGAGTLYPPGCMSGHVFDIGNIRDLCLNADDIWLKVMQVLAGTPVVLVRPNACLQYIEDTQTETLQEANVGGGENDTQLTGVLKAYGLLEGQDSAAARIFGQGPWEAVPDTAGLPEMGRLSPAAEVKLVALRMENDCLRGEIQNIHRSCSYRLGRFLTFVPRKLRGGIRCWQEHGLRYTLRRVKEKWQALLGG